MATVKHHRTNMVLNIQVTESALKHFLTCLNPRHQGIRLFLKKTGCSGLSYVLDPVEMPQKDDLSIPLTNQYQLFVAKDDYAFLKNIQIDYVKQGLAYKVVFFNPNQTGQCGCGESFTVK